jgi:Na+/H+ antiporter NhaC
MSNQDSNKPQLLRRYQSRIIITLIFLGMLAGLAFVVPAGPDGALVRGGPLSLLPPLLAIGIAIIWRQIHLAILLGIFGGALLLSGMNPVTAAVDTAWVFVGPTAVNPDNLYLFAFTLSLMGMVGVLIRNGGIEGVVKSLSGLARGRRSTQAVVAAMGTAVFFDDYANAVVVGSSARALTDRAKISREKLAYLVDSTAAPVASIAIISTWIGIEIGLLDKQLEFLSSVAPTGYGVFIHLIPYRFYCLFTLVMVFAIAISGRDYGPMLKAERRAAKGQLMGPNARPLAAESFRRLRPKDGVVTRAVNGFLPILVVLGTILFSFYYSGSRSLAMAGQEVSIFSLTSWRDCFCSVENTGFLLTAAGLLGSLVAISMSLAQRLLTWREAFHGWVSGARSMLGAVALLVVAMTLRKVTDADHLALADYVLSLMSGTDAVWIPISVFLAAGAIAFSTGTSYGTMGILIPVAVPLAARVGDPLILILATGAVLDGAVFGDHCSPISDTTVLSSIGSTCDHMDHVRTQAPYAVTSMMVAAMIGYLLLPMAGITLTLAYGTGIFALCAWVWLVGRKTAKQ